MTPTMKTCKRCANFIAYDGKDFCGECSGGRKKVEKLSMNMLPILGSGDVTINFPSSGDIMNKINEIIERVNGDKNE